MFTPVSSGASEASVTAATPLAAVAANAGLPMVFVAFAAVGLLLVIALDLRKLKMAARLTVAQAAVGGTLALMVVSLTLMMASSLLPDRSANALDNPGGLSEAVTDNTEFPDSGLQLPTLGAD